MLQEKTDKYFLKYRHDEHTSHLTGKNKKYGLEVTDRKLKVLLSGYFPILQVVRPAE